MPNCGNITDDIFNNCDETLIGGVRDKLVLFNLGDLLPYTKNVSNAQIIEAINLITSPSARGYVFEGQNNSNDISTELTKGAYSVGYTHKIVFRIFGNNAEIKIQLESLAKGKTVAVVQNNFQGSMGESAFELFGADAGLEVLEMTSDKSDADTQGAYVVTLSTNAKFKEGHLPATVFINSFEDTNDMINALL